MLNVNRLLVATDFSSSAERARRQAEHLAALHDAALHVLHVTDDAELAELFDALPPDKATPRRAQVYLAEWLGRPIAPPQTRAAGTPPRAVPPDETWTVRWGRAPAERILDVAEEVEADGLLLGAGQRRELFGSVTDRVIRRATRPVITVPAAPDDDGSGRVPDVPPRETLRRILVPVDFSGLTEPLVEHARALAGDTEARIDLVHVVSDASPAWAPWGTGSNGTGGQIHRRLEEIAEATLPAGLPVRCRVLDGARPAPTLVRYAEEQATDLILMGTHGRTGLRRMMRGSVTEAVIRRTPCPVGTLRGDTRLLRPDPGDEAGPAVEDISRSLTPVLA
jgi:nucleotide-binding universal stress UspA family protein